MAKKHDPEMASLKEENLILRAKLDEALNIIGTLTSRALVKAAEHAMQLARPEPPEATPVSAEHVEE